MIPIPQIILLFYASTIQPTGASRQANSSLRSWRRDELAVIKNTRHLLAIAVPDKESIAVPLQYSLFHLLCYYPH